MKTCTSAFIAMIIMGTGLAAFGQSITITSPAGGERWAIGSAVAITWTATGVTGMVRINLIDRNGEVAGQIARRVDAGLGRCPWVVGEMESGAASVGRNYRVRIRSIDTEAGETSGQFEITVGFTPPEIPGEMEPAPVLAVTAPRRTDRWCREQEYPLAWTAGGVSSAVVRITLRQGDREALVIDAAAPNSGAFPWTVPATLAVGSYMVRVAAPDMSRYDDSDAFEVRDCAATPRRIPPPDPGARLRVTVPAGGETWSAYSEYHIEWESQATSACGTQVDIKTVAMKGGTERLIARNVSNREGRNYFLWKIGESESPFGPGQFRIRLVSSTGCVANSPYFHVTACDYGIESVSLADGRPMSDGVDWEPGASLAVSLQARITRDGAMPPADSTSTLRASVRLRDGTMREVGTAAISAGLRDGIRLQTLRCSIPMPDVAVPMNMRIPLHFKIVSDVDRVHYNDEHDAELRLLGHEPTDLAIRADGGSMRITRLYDALPTPTHRIYITLYAQNLTPNAAGGPPPPVADVLCKWHVEEREDSGSWHSAGGNEFHFGPVPFGSELRKDAVLNVSLDDGKSCRLILEIDPDMEKNDPQRRNNTAQVGFRMPD